MRRGAQLVPTLSPSHHLEEQGAFGLTATLNTYT